VTSDPKPEPVRDLSGRRDIATLRPEVAAVKDIMDFAMPNGFETDEELDDYLRWY
jgi:hypothetical protein